jgi:YVTN family beta-propeller protein
MKILRVLAPLAVAALLFSQPASREQPGPLAGGGFLLNTGWRLNPAGKQVPAGAFPMASVTSPDGKYLLVLNAGAPPSIVVLDTASGAETGRVSLPDAFLGLAFGPKGDRVYAGGGAQAAVLEFSFQNGKLQPARSFPVVEPSKRTRRDFIGDVALSPDGRLIYAADFYQDSIAVINPQSGRVIERFKTGRRPYRILFHPDGKSFFVSSWAEGSVYHQETDNGNILSRTRLGPHPTDMVWAPGKPKPEMEGEEVSYADRIFVAASNTNTVYSVGVAASQELRTAEVISVALTPNQPAGMTPSALAFDPETGRLFVACSDANAVSVLDVSSSVSRVLGFIPTGRYPTAVRWLPNGKLAVLNGLGQTAGTVSFIEPFEAEQLDRYTKAVRENSPYRDSQLFDAGTGAGNPVPSDPADPTPIDYVVYILEAADAQASPNHQKLAREFALLDNFYILGNSAIEGYQWATAGIASDYVQKLSRSRAADAFGADDAAVAPPAGYLWTNARSAGITVKMYGPGGSDTETAGLLQRDLEGFETAKQMPRLLLVRLTGQAAANSDRAIGAMISALSKSSFWPKMSIFVMGAGVRERAPAWVISPYVKRKVVDGTMYNTLSVLRTAELLLGLRPMTQFDAAARTLAACFQTAVDATPYLAASQ